MANEAVMINAPQRNPIRGTVLDASAVEKGALMFWQDPLTLSGSNATNTNVAAAGIAAVEKVASDGSVTLGVYTDGVWDLKVNANTTITAGQLVKISGANMIDVASGTDLDNGYVLGKALETAAASEVIAVKVDC